ncbi:hypothetical protein LguiB_023250 [Lonicera macranthoides]
MPKNNELKTKSRRKPLGDISNGVKIVSRSYVKKNSDPQNDDRGGDDALDRLLLVHSHISTLIHQIDGLVVQALKVTSKKGRKEIESFADVLFEMQTSLKPWVPRFQKALFSPSTITESQLEQPLVHKTPSVNEDIRESIDSPDESKMDSLVSPSPLVCWRAESTTENGRQLFLLTPLPRPKTCSSKALESSKLIFDKITSNTAGGPPPSHFAFSENMNGDWLESVALKSTPFKPSDSIASNFERNLTLDCGSISPTPCKKTSSMFALTPCLKMSPPKSCVLLEPVSEVFHKYNPLVCKSTPFPDGVQNFSDSKSSGGEVSEHSETFGIEPSQKLENRQKVTEEWSNWFMSPPKTCILMEPSGEKFLNNSATDCVNQQINLFSMNENGTQGGQALTNKSHNQEIENTPMWKDPESAMQTGKLPGENTLKKELWTKFEAATTSGIRINVPALQETARKGFLDRLEEASCDEASPLNEDPR